MSLYVGEQKVDAFSGIPINPASGTVNITENGIHNVSEYAEANVNVQGGAVSDGKSGVKFIDYDGTLVDAWESTDVASKTELPANPTHDGLTAQGWNWDLQHIKDYAEDYPNALVLVGQMYKTTSGLTEMDITVTKVTGLTVTCNMVGDKDWGDGTQDALTTHTYEDYGDYTITCGDTAIPAGTSSSGGLFGSGSSNVNRYWCTAIRIGSNVTSIGKYAIMYCYSLTNVTIPQSVTRIGSSAFDHCYSLTNVTIPQGMTSVANNAFSNCCSLTTVTIPQSVTSISDNTFYECRALINITIPQSVTSIVGYAFRNCYSLARITIPQSVISIGSYDFGDCYSLIRYDFSNHLAIPTLVYSNTFSNINGICKIIVPDALYDDWIVARNWTTYANYIYKASEVTD